MNGRERMDVAMRLGTPDRVPFMCQLSLGHYFLQAGLDPVVVWHSTDGFADALVRLRARYGFDGILVNLPGRDPAWRTRIARRETRGGETILEWRNGRHTVVPPDDNPHVYLADGTRGQPAFEAVEPERLYYVEPHDLAGITYPQTWRADGEPAIPGPNFFAPWHADTISAVVARTRGEVSVHGEVFSPFSQLLELVDYANGLMALLTDPEKVKACLARLAAGAVHLARLQVEAGAHAILISSAFVGAGFLSRRHYEEFVLPFERAVVDGIKAAHDVPVYTHTCGAIGDRLDLMMATGTNGIDTLDPPPLGTVDLAQAIAVTKGRVFIKGNIDPVNTLLLGSVDDVGRAASERLRIAAPGGGYVLSTACSVPPATPPANILALRDAIEREGRYDLTGLA